MLTRIRRVSRRATLKVGLAGTSLAVLGSAALAWIVTACSGDSKEDDDDDDKPYGYGRGPYGRGPFGSRQGIGPSIIRKT